MMKLPPGLIRNTMIDNQVLCTAKMDRSSRQESLHTINLLDVKHKIKIKNLELNSTLQLKMLWESFHLHDMIMTTKYKFNETMSCFYFIWAQVQHHYM